jgi:2,3-bisphosphoglycerate-dependent phosphoglycerate mutase
VTKILKNSEERSMKIFLLRHGESYDDIEDCYGGIADFALTDAGRKTAEELAKKLASSTIQVLYTSPYKRAYETATIVGRTLGCETKTIYDLRERNSYGVLSGVNKARAKEIFSHVIGKLKRKPGDYYSNETVVGAEPIQEFNTRVKRAFDEVVCAGAKYNVIGVVTHGNVTRAIYHHIFGIEGKVELELLATTEINYQPAVITIERKQGVAIVQ